MRALLVALISALGLVACGGDSGYADLDAFMAEKRARPGGHMEPIPPFKAYKAFSYSAASMRSPFDRPIQIVSGPQLGKPTIKPDLDRTKEYLEQFTFDSLSMVGTLAKGDEFFVLIQDDAGGIHRVKKGNYVGRNHGRIVETTETYIAVIEIVSDGNEGWMERPRTIKLNMAG